MALSIGIVTGSISRKAGGLFNSVRQSAIHLKAAGAEVSVYALEDEHSAADRAAWAPIEPQVLPVRFARALPHAPDLDRRLAAGRHDVVHLHGIWQLQSLSVRRWKRRTGRPVMISPRGMLDPWALARARWKKRLAAAAYERRNLLGADCLHALNEAEAQAMRSYGLRNPVAIIPNGTGLPEEVMQAGPPADGGRRQLLYLGRIHPKKGLAELTDAWAHLHRSHPSVAGGWRLVIAGWDDGGHLPGLRAAGARHGLDEESLHFAGPAFGAAKDALLRASHAFILPSFSEGLPMSVLEAWSYRLPVFKTRHCNIPIGFTAGAAIEIPMEVDAMSRTLSEALSRADLAQLGERGRCLAESHFQWPNIAAMHVEVYRWLMSGGARPSCVILD